MKVNPNRRINISTGAVLGYMFSPQLGRRIKNLSLNTQWIALMLASIFQMIRLLPTDLSSTALKDTKNLTIRGVMAQAANNVNFNIRHSDQVIIYCLVLVGFVLLAMQFAILAFVMTTNLAHAQLQFMGFFQAPLGANLTNDIAFGMLDQVFGIPGLYGTKYDPIALGGIPPFTRALQSTFYFYNFAMSTVASFLVIYFLFVVVIETIEDGTPFGKRFASGYVPLRLIIALAFLVPTYYGFSTGQHLILNVAKIGGNFATNSWLRFIDSVQTPIGTGGDELLARPTTPNATALIEGLLLANLCATYHKQEYHTYYAAETDDAGNLLYTVQQPVTVNAAGNVTAQNEHTFSGGRPYPIDVYTIYDVKEESNVPAIFNGLGSAGGPAPVYYTTLPAGATAVTNSFDTFITATDTKDVRIRFGQIHPAYRGDLVATEGVAPTNGGIRPICGEIVIPGAPTPNAGPADAFSAAGTWRMGNMAVVMNMWMGNLVTPYSQRMLAINGMIDGVQGCDIDVPLHFGVWSNAAGETSCNEPPPAAYYQRLFDQFKTSLAADLNNAYLEAVDEAKEHMWFAGGNNPNNNKILTYGWAGAGMWYNEISDLYGAYTNVFKVGYVKSYPEILNEVAKAKRTVQESARGTDMFNPVLPDGQVLALKNPNDLQYAKMMHQVVTGLTATQNAEQYARHDNTSGFVNMINIIFGLEGVFNLRENGDIHPFGALVGAGKGLMDSSILALTGTIFTEGITGFLSAMGATTGAKVSQVATTISSMAATVGLTAGIILFYVIPLTPFMYFFLAAGRWVKSIFEAMIAVPLWAMAHIRIDGTGLPGVAGNGYFLVFEIFLRPVLTLFGLLASITTYGALMVIFNDIFDLVVDNLANNNIDANAAANDQDYIDTFRGTVDMFFYTVLYAIIAYMMAMASFKLIDLIPDSILRWMGAGVKSFGDESGNIAEGLNRTISIQGTMAAGSVKEIASGVGGAGGQAAGGIARGFKR